MAVLVYKYEQLRDSLRGPEDESKLNKEVIEQAEISLERYVSQRAEKIRMDTGGQTSIEEAAAALVSNEGIPQLKSVFQHILARKK